MPPSALFQAAVGGCFQRKNIQQLPLFMPLHSRHSQKVAADVAHAAHRENSLKDFRIPKAEIKESGYRLSQRTKKAGQKHDSKFISVGLLLDA